MNKKGKKIFTEEEAKKIRTLLKEKVEVEGRLKNIFRRRMRDLGFYISDYKKTRSEFTLEDFNSLVNNEHIEINY